MHRPLPLTSKRSAQELTALRLEYPSLVLTGWRDRYCGVALMAGLMTAATAAAPLAGTAAWLVRCDLPGHVLIAEGAAMALDPVELASIEAGVLARFPALLVPKAIVAHADGLTYWQAYARAMAEHGHWRAALTDLPTAIERTVGMFGVFEEMAERRRRDRCGR